jgi:hypothetical protein
MNKDMKKAVQTFTDLFSESHSWALANQSVIGASRLSDDDDSKNYGLKWKLAESVHWRNNIFTASQLSSFSKLGFC